MTTKTQGARMAKGVVTAASASVVSMLMWGCQVQEPPPFDPRAIIRGEVVTSGAQPTPPMLPLPTTRGARIPDTQPTTRAYTVEEPQVVRMPLREIQQRAAANSAEVRVAGYDPAVAETKVIENLGHYDPVLYSNLRYDKQADRTPGTVIPNPSNPSQTITITTENNNIYTAELGIKQYLESGGQIQLGYQFQNSDYNPVRYTTNNYWDAELKLQLTQPLLREFGYEINWARITVARNDQRVSQLDFRKALEDNTEELEKDYWQLYEAEMDVETSEQVLDQSRDLARVLWDQVITGGQATELEAAQAQSTLEQRRVDLKQARQRVAEISLDIKRRMSDPDFKVAGPVEILPADAPAEAAVTFELQDQIETAMNNRLELGQQQIRENSAEVARQVAKNGLFPKLDFVGSVALQGLAQNLDTAISQQFGDSHFIYSLGLQLEVPIGNREAAAIMKRAYLQEMQAMASYENLVQQVSQAVTQAWWEVKTTYSALADARKARMFAESVLTHLNERQESGAQPLDYTFVLQKLDAQARLGDTKRLEAQQLANYNIALSALERAKGTILRYNNILMEEEPLPGSAVHKKGSMP
jgi:outer membrane protein TolC